MQRHVVLRRAELLHNFHVLQPRLHQLRLKRKEFLVEVGQASDTDVDTFLLHVHLKQVLYNGVVGYHEVKVGHLGLLGPLHKGGQAGEERVWLSGRQQDFYYLAEVLEKVWLVLFWNSYFWAKAHELGHRQCVLSRRL